MPNSTISLQNVVDYSRTIGSLAPVLPTAGFSNFLPMEIASDVMAELLSKKFNWKFNRTNVPPFVTSSLMQDYASLNMTNIGWLEHCAAIDINNTALPKPIKWLECVRDLERTSLLAGLPSKICWLPNDQLSFAAWPGAGLLYVNPIGAVSQPSNPPLNILDANGNILILTTYGTTGNSAPVLPAASATGTTVADGSCVWTVANPKGQGFRINAIPAQVSTVFQLVPVAQMRPIRFSTMGQLLDPIPDDYSKWFKDGYIAYLHRHSTSPAVQAQFEKKKAEWLMAMASAVEQGAREKDDAAFIPGSSIMGENFGAPITAAWPYPPYR